TPSIAASPIDERRVVTVSQDDTTGNQECSVYVSTDGGLSYDFGFLLPLLNVGDFCADPVVRATPPAPDGHSNFVFTYMSERSTHPPPPAPAPPGASGRGRRAPPPPPPRRSRGPRRWCPRPSASATGPGSRSTPITTRPRPTRAPASSTWRPRCSRPTPTARS